MQVSLNVASHEVRRVHQVSGADGRIAETQVRASEAAGLLGVIREVSLAVLVGVVADDFHGVLVGTYRTVGTQTVELGFEHAFAAHGDFLFLRQGSERHIIYDADGEVVLRRVQLQVVIYSQDLCRRGVFRTQTVASAHDERSIFCAVEAVLDVHIQRFAIGTRLLRAVQHSDALGCLGHSSQEVLGGERTVEVNSYEAHFLAFGRQVVNNLADGFRYRTHSDDDALGIGSTIVVEQAIFAARDFADLLHVILYDGRYSLIERIASLAVLEEVVGVLGHTTHNGIHGVHGAAAEFG